MANLATSYRNQGRWKEAEELEVQVMETSMKVFGQEHQDTLTSMGNLASTYWYQGRWKKAEELQVQVMETFKRILGQEHPDTLTIMNNLASTYDKQGRWTEAEILLIEATNTCRTTLGDNHPNTVLTNASLATLRKNREAPWRLSDQNGLEYRLHEALQGLSAQFPDRLLQFAIARSLKNNNTGEETLQHSASILHKSGDNDDFGTDEAKLRLGLAMSLEMDEDSDSDQERLQRALAMSLEADEENDTCENYETNEDNETDEERLQRALALSLEEENDHDEISCVKREYSPNLAGSLIPVIIGVCLFVLIILHTPQLEYDST
jgi:tetratricopeptide (TPR) repeat protein